MESAALEPGRCQDCVVLLVLRPGGVLRYWKVSKCSLLAVLVLVLS